MNTGFSFGYFERPDDDDRVIATAYRALRPGGTFVVETIGKEVVARVHTAQKRSWAKLPDGTLLLKHSEIVGDWDAIRLHWTLVGNAEPVQRSMSQRLYSATELRERLRQRVSMKSAATATWMDAATTTMHRTW